jgi:hypothetical protein
MNQSETDLGIVNESQLLRFGISGSEHSFDHLVGAAEQRERNGEAERLGSLEVED